MAIGIFTPAEKRLALLLFLLTLIGLLARGGRKLSPEIAAWLDEVAEHSTASSLVGGDTVAVEVGKTPEEAGADGAAAPGNTGGDLTTRVDPNRATIKELTTLPGVGPVLARRILEDRNQNGRYTIIEDLLRVSGIGKATLERIRPHVALTPPP